MHSKFKGVTQGIKAVRFSGERRVLWWKPWLGDTALHKMADLEVATQLVARNYQVHLIVPTTKGKMKLDKPGASIISIQIRFLPLISPIVRCFLIMFIFPYYILKLKPDYVITEPDISILGLFPTLFLCKLLRIKVVLDIRSVPVETFGLQGFMINLWFSVSMSFARRFFDGITAITILMKEDLCGRFHISRNKIGVWTSGVSTRLFDPSKYASEASVFKNKLGLSSKFVVFYHGRFSPTRGLKQSIQAMKKIHKLHPNITLFLLGSGPITSELQQLIREEKLDCSVLIHDPVDQSQVPRFISACDVAIVPLPNTIFWRSQSPLKLLEYLAMEKPVIVTDIPAHRTVLGENECGRYFASIKPSDISDAIEFAYINEEKFEQWGKNGRKIVENGYTWERVAADLDHYLSSLT